LRRVSARPAASLRPGGLAGGIAVRIAALTDDQRAGFRAKLEEAVEPYRTDAGYAIPAITQNTLAA
jgi:hypothetical protein